MGWRWTTEVRMLLSFPTCMPTKPQGIPLGPAPRARGGGRAVLALPGVEADVVVVAAGGEEGCALEVEEQVEAQVVAIEANSSVQVGDLEVDVSDAGLGWNGWFRHV